MRKSTPVVKTQEAEQWFQFFSQVLFLPLLGVYALWLAGDYLQLIHLTQLPDFWSQNVLKANFVCWGPGIMALSWALNKNAYFPQVAPFRNEEQILKIIFCLTLGLLLIVNTVIFVLHFTLFSPEHYVRCWEPYPFGVWHYAKTEDICINHGLAPVRFLERRE